MTRWVTFLSVVLWAALAVPPAFAHDDNDHGAEPKAEPAAEPTVEDRINALEKHAQQTETMLTSILEQLTVALKPPATDPPTTEPKDAEPPASEPPADASETPPAIDVTSALEELSQRVSTLELNASETDTNLSQILAEFERLLPVVGVLSQLRVLRETDVEVAKPESAPVPDPPRTNDPGGADVEPQPPGEVQGKLTIQNDTDVVQKLRINGVVYEISPGVTDLWTPYGELTTQLDDHEAAKTWSAADWTWRRQNYELKIIVEN